MAKKRIQVDREWTLNKVKPIENINKNLQNFSGKSHVLNEVLPSFKLLDHAYE